MTAETLDPKAKPRSCRFVPVSRDLREPSERTDWRCVVHGDACPHREVWAE